MAGAAALTFGQRSFPQAPVGARGRFFATIVVIAGAGALLLSRARSSPQNSIGPLVSASRSYERPVELRLSGGFAWAPFRSPRGNRPPVPRVLSAAIGTVLRSVEGESAPASRHTAGVAELLAGHPRKALANLATAAEQSNDAAAWNDLAAAFHENAVLNDTPELLGDALAAADRALSRQPQFPEALFNRALIIERLALRDDAREAWERYLTSDSAGEWAAEARKHLDALAPEEPFLGRLDREYDRVGNDPAFAAALARQNPFDARSTGVKEILGRWGKAVLSHDKREAERHLRVARQLGAAVAVAGDRMIDRAVAVIDAADPATRVLLASAHADYLDGLNFRQANRPVEAEPLFRRAAGAFEKAQSPMDLPARFFAASMVFEQGRHDEAEREIERIASAVSTDFPAYRALMLRQLGACRASRAEWGAAITILSESATLFDRLGEIRNSSDVRRLLAFVYDRIGDPATAWKYRLAALRGMGGRSTGEVEQAVASIADAAMLRHEWHTALSFLTLEIRIAQRIHDELLSASTTLIRAVVRDRLSDEAGALADILEAKEAAARMKGPSYRTYLRVAALRASAMLSSTPPAEADALLSEAIEYQSTKSDPLKLPGLFLQRARARRKIGNAAGALTDVRRGIAELEQHRQSLPPGEARWGAFHAAEELFDEGVDLSMAAGDAEAAFRFAESARARALLDSYGVSPVLDYRRLPARTVVVEYASLPSRLIIFTVDASGVRAASVDCSREKLIAVTDALRESLRTTRSAVPGDQAAAVYRRLVEPVAVQLLSATTVVFVPDAATATVAFSALSDAHGQYLLEQHGIVLAPSGAAFLAAAERRGQPAPPRSALVLSASQEGGGGGALSFVNAEAQRVAKVYGKATRLADDAAELDELKKRAPEADVIQFSGHAVGDDRGIEPASMILRQNGQERRVGVAVIAGLRLRPTAIVVLAGCSTARGERRAAEGVISVAHGFLSAGASSVIATLWPIDDEASAVFFPRLHEKIAQGMSAAEALRQVQLESIRRGDVPASLWAAVQDVGS